MGFTARAQALIAEIQNAGNWGLPADAFDLPAASDLPATTEAQAVDEIKLALAVLKYARYARGGRVSPGKISNLFDQKPELSNPKTVLTEIAASPAPAAYLTSLHPKHAQFESLRKLLIKYVANAKARGRKPMADPAIQRLIVNMERWRWMPADLGSYYVWNNMPVLRHPGDEERQVHLCREGHCRAAEICDPDLLGEHALHRVQSGLDGARHHQVRRPCAPLAPGQR